MEKNYTLNAPAEAYIGETIIRVKDYWIETRPLSKMEAKNDFMIDFFGPDFTCTKGDTFKIKGTTQIGGQKAFLLEAIFVGYPLYIAVYQDGCFANRLIGYMNQILQGWTANPSHFCFEKIEDNEILKTKGFINYEIVFTGLNDKEILLLYREYTPDDLAKVAFYQNLTYPKSSEILRFRNLRIALNDVSNERIEYTVIND